MKLTPEKLDFFKWFVTSVVIGSSGLWINSNHADSELALQNKRDSTQLEIQRIEADSKLVTAVTSSHNAQDESDSALYKYLYFVEAFVTTDEVQGGIRGKIEDLTIRLENKVRSDETRYIQKTETENAKNSAYSPDELNKKESEFLVSASVDSEEVNINELHKFEKNITNDSKIVTVDSLVSLRINKTKTMVVPTIIKEEESVYKLLNQPITKWCKAGYYVIFDNQLKINIESLDLDKITIDITINGVFQKTKEIHEGQSINALYGNKKYVISLDYIGSAGRNPLKKAAYLTTSVYTKKQ